MTRKQKELLDFIRQYTTVNGGVSPSFAEMKAAINLNSKSGVHRILVALEKDGYIRRRKHRARAIIVSCPALHGVSNEEIVEECNRRGLVIGRIINFPNPSFPDGIERKFALLNGSELQST